MCVYCKYIMFIFNIDVSCQLCMPFLVPPIITTMNCETPNIDPNVPTTYPDHHQSAAAAGGYTPVQSKPPYRLPDEPTFPQLMRQQQQQQQHPPSSQTVHSPPEEPHGMMPPYGSSSI